ncbi:MAG: hypothetical protein CL878_04995 [Dehalococcoidia bacterium]|nr:hypothetical protein [Dehalococcoidia bacterium]
MSLRVKALGIVGLALVVVSAALYVVARSVTLDNAAELERASARENLERALHALSMRIERLDETNLDWASWDDSYAFVQDGNEAYVESNLVEETFGALRVNLITFVNGSGQIVWQQGLDLESEEEMPVPDRLRAFAWPDDPLLQHTDLKRGTKGLLLLEERPLMLSSRPILTSEDEGPRHGTLIMGRYLDEDVIAQLAASTQLSLQLRLLDDPALPRDFLAARASMTEQTPIAVHPLSSESVAGYTELDDFSGEPKLILRVDMPRSIYATSQGSLRVLVLALLGVGVGLGLVVLVLLETLVVSPVAKLSANVRKIANGQSPSSRVAVSGNDEVAALAVNVNGILDALAEHQEATERELAARMETEAELREHYTRVERARSEARAILDAATEAMILVSPSGVVTAFNRSFASRILTGRPGEIIGEHLEVLTAHFERLFGVEVGAVPLMAGTAPNREGVLSLDVLQRWPERRELQLTSTPVHSGDGSYVGRLYTFRDVTRDREMGHLMSDFVSQVAHDVRTPLTSIRGYVQMLLDGESASISPTQRRHLGNVQRNADRLAALVDNLLDSAQLEAGEMRLDFSDVDLANMIREVSETLRPQVEGKDQTLTLALDEGLWPVLADALRLTQVVDNLLSNAYKYTPPGGDISVAARNRADDVVVEVRDTGVGLSEGEQAQLFTKFYRARRTEDRKTEGTGLGLAIARSIITLHHGDIWVESTPGNGATFCFTVPVAQRVPATVGQGTAGRAGRSGQPDVLRASDRDRR